MWQAEDFRHVLDRDDAGWEPNRVGEGAQIVRLARPDLVSLYTLLQVLSVTGFEKMPIQAAVLRRLADSTITKEQLVGTIHFLTGQQWD
jgi:hypothetical protein